MLGRGTKARLETVGKRAVMELLYQVPGFSFCHQDRWLWEVRGPCLCFQGPAEGHLSCHRPYRDSKKGCSWPSIGRPLH